MDRKLTEKQRAFVEHYVANNFNAKQAAISAGYSENTAETQASQLLKKTQVREYLAKFTAKTAKKIQVNAERVIQELAAIAFSDIRNVARWNGGDVVMVPSEDIDDITARSIQSITLRESSGKETSSRNLQIKQYDKLKALELLGKHLALWSENDLNVNVQINQLKALPLEDVLARGEAARQFLRKLKHGGNLNSSDSIDQTFPTPYADPEGYEAERGDSSLDDAEGD